MKKQGFIAVGITVATLAGVLTGCGSGGIDTSPDEIAGVNAQELIAQALENIDNCESCRSNTKIVVNGSVNADGTDMAIKVNNNYSLESSRGQEAVHTKTDTEILMLEQENEETREEYIYKENNGDVIGYISDDTAGSWSKETLNESALESRYIDSMVHSLTVIDGIVAGYVPATVEGVETINGQKAYKITAPIMGDYLKNAMTELIGEEYIGASDIDFSDISSSFSLYIYKDSVLPAKVVADYADAFEQVEEKSLEEMGTEVTATMKEASLEMVFSDYDNVTVIIPENVKRSAAK